MGARRAAREADDASAGIRVPVWGAEAHEGRNEVDAAAVRHGSADRLALGGRPDKTQLVAKPLDCGARNEHAPLERIVDSPLESPRDRRQEIARLHRALARVEEHEAPCAVGVLGESGAKARLAEER